MGSDSWWSGEDFSSGFSRQMTSKKEAVPAGVEEVRHFVKERDVSTENRPSPDFWRLQISVSDFRSMKHISLDFLVQNVYIFCFF